MVENFGGLVPKYIFVEEILADKLFVQQISLDKIVDGYNFGRLVVNHQICQILVPLKFCAIQLT